MAMKLLHMGLQVNSYAKAQAFFCDGLGMEPIYTGTIGEFKHILDPSVDPASDPREQMGYIRVCQGQYFEMFEGIVEPPDFDPKPIHAYEDMAFVEVGLGVADMADAVDRIRARGLEVRDNCVFDPDGNRYRLVETGGPIREHIIVQLAHIAMRVNDLDAAIDYYTKLGLVAKRREKGLVELCAETGSVLLLQSERPLVKHVDTALNHIAYGLNSLEEMRECAQSLAGYGLPVYRNVNKDEILKTEPGCFDPDQGPDGSIGMRAFDPDDNYCEVIFMPPDNRQNIFEQKYPFC